MSTIPDKMIFNSHFLWLLDPGHGGMMNGQYQTEGKKAEHSDFTFYEGVFNRQIRGGLMNELRRRKLSFVNLVPEEKDIALHQRVERAKIQAKKHPDKKPVFLSLHANYFRNPNVTGIEIFTSPGETLSDKIATHFYNQIKKVGWDTRPGWGDGDPDKEEKFYVLWETPMAALLIEHGFFSNEDQARALMNPDIQEKFTRLEAEAAKKCEKEVITW